MTTAPPTILARPSRRGRPSMADTPEAIHRNFGCLRALNSGFTTDDLARLFRVSRRTIQARVAAARAHLAASPR